MLLASLLALSGAGAALASGGGAIGPATVSGHETAATSTSAPTYSSSSLPPFPSNLTHFIYIVREDHDFDDYLGDCATTINATCNGGTDQTGAYESDVPDLHAIARSNSVFDNYYTSLSPYAGQAHQFEFTGTENGSGTVDSCAPGGPQGMGPTTEWGVYNDSAEAAGSCAYSPDGDLTYPSTGSVFDRLLGPDVTTSGTTPPFLSIGDITWELSSPGCTHDGFGAIAGGRPGNSEAIEYVSCNGANGWWYNTTSHSPGMPPVINPTTHTPEFLDVCNYECGSLSTYLDQWAANDFVSYVADYGLPTYTYIDLFDDHPGSECGATQTDATCVQWNDAATNEIVQSIENGSSPYRNNTVIAIEESNTQNGQNSPDHVNNGRRVPFVLVAPANVMKTGDPNPSACGISVGPCGNIVHGTYNDSNTLALMERVELNVHPDLWSATPGSLDTFPMVLNDELAAANPFEAVWRCASAGVPCNEGPTTPVFASTSISPSSVQVDPDGTQDLSASAQDQTGASLSATFVWTAYPSSLGTLSATAGSTTIFTAGNNAGSGNVCENATYGAITREACDPVVVGTPVPVLTSSLLSPASDELFFGNATSFFGVGLDQNGQPMGGSTFTWSASPSSLGTLNASTTASEVGHATFVAGDHEGSVVLTMQIANGGAPVQTQTVTIAIVAPQLELKLSASASSGAAPLTVDLSVSASGGQPPYTFAWTFDDGGTATGTSVQHTFVSAGSFEIKAYVNDTSRQSAAAFWTVNVTAGAVPPSSHPSSSGLSEGTAVVLVGLVVLVMASGVAYALRRRSLSAISGASGPKGPAGTEKLAPYSEYEVQTPLTSPPAIPPKVGEPPRERDPASLDDAL